MKRFVAFVIAAVMCCSMVCVSAEKSQASILDFPAKLQIFLYACILNDVPVYGNGYTDIKVSDATHYYTYDYEGMALKYYLDEGVYRFSIVIEDKYRPWCYMLAIQHFCGVPLDEAAAAYCNLYMRKGTSSKCVYDFNGMSLELTNTALRIRGIPNV